jgi:hydroxymethylpyrimidine pyrophosphatase-like HAD family hydrolase
MFLFASDLDQTLIYSRRAFRSEVIEEKIQLIESVDGREISFMTLRAIELLKEISAMVTFIPVTTRTIEQYNRIQLFKDKIIPSYAVTSNGGNILHNGTIDQEWNTLLKDKLRNCIEKEVIIEKFKEISHEEWVQPPKTADDLFCYAIVSRDKVPHDELKTYTNWLSEQGWDYSLQGRKLYFVPKPINKWAAVQYIKEKTNHSFIASAGDSLLDLCLLENANYSYAPLHGELDFIKKNFPSHIMSVRERGIKASEEILDNVLDLMKLNGYL